MLDDDADNNVDFCFAEDEGFKPPIPGKGIPDFESSAFDHSANLPRKSLQRYIKYWTIRND